MGWGFVDWARGKRRPSDNRRPKLRANPSERELRGVINLLLDDEQAFDAYKLLDEHKQQARPVLESVLASDLRFRSMAGKVRGWGNPIFDVVLSTLFEWNSEYAAQETLRLVDSPEPALREIAAKLLASTGGARFIDELVRLAHDQEKSVREAVAQGLSDALEGARVYHRKFDDALARALYDLMLDCALRTDQGPGCMFAEALFRADRARAMTDLLRPQVLSLKRTWLSDLLKSFRKLHIRLRKECLVGLLGDATVVFDREDFSLHEHCLLKYTVTELLLALAVYDRSEANQWMQRLRSHPQGEARAAVQDAREKMSANPITIAIQAYENAGSIQRMRPEHRTVYLVWLLDAEVANGGWIQWAANSSGGYAVETLDALRAIGALAAADELLMVIDALGPGFERMSQSKRKKAIDDMLNENRSLPDDGTMWQMRADLNALVYDYAGKHHGSFAPSPETDGSMQ